MRVLKRILNWTIWSLVVLHVVVVLSIQLSPVQAWLGQRVAALLSKALDTHASIGSVGVGFPGRLIVDDVLILDQGGEPLLRAGRLSVKVELLPLLEGRIAIASAQLFGVDIRLTKEDEKTPANYQFVIDALSSNDTTSSSNLDLRVNSLIMRRGSISYDRHDVFKTPGQLNTNHLAVKDISAHVILKTLTPDTLNVNLKRLACTEQSGLTVNRFAARLEANHEQALLTGLTLQLPNSRLKADTVKAHYDDNDIASTLRYAGTIDSTNVIPADLAALLPVCKNFRQTLAINGAFSGTAKTIDCHRLVVDADDGSLTLQATAGLDANDSIAAWHAEIDYLTVAEELTAQMKQAIPSLPDEVVRLGDISLTGTASRQRDGLTDATAEISTSLGHAGLSLTLGSDRQLAANLLTDNFHLGRLLNNEKLGTVATKINLGGTPQSIKVIGNVDRIEWNGYPYTQMQLNGTYEPQTGIVAGHLLIDDPNLQADVEGGLTNIVATDSRQARQKEKTVRVTGYIERLSPKALNLSDRWGDAKFSAVIDADVTASSLEDAHGSLDIDDFQMATDADSTLYMLDNLHVKSGFDDGLHFLRITGDMGEVEMAEGEINYVRLQLDDTDWMQQLLNIPLQLHAPLRVTATIDDQYQHVDMNGSLPAFTYAGARYNDLRLKLNTEDDTIRCNAALTMLLKNGGEMQLDLNADTRLFKNEEGGTEAHVHVKPSQMMLKGTPWNLKPCNIYYSDHRLEVDSFSVAHDNQHLIIDGVASEEPGDTLIVDLNDMEVAYILDLVNFHAVKFDGMATGKAYATQLFGDFAAWTDLVVGDFRFLDGEMGTLYAKANWNKEDKQIDIDATVFDSPSRVKTMSAPLANAFLQTDHLSAPWQSATLRVDSASVQWPNTYIVGYVSLVRSDINLDIRAQGTNVDFCRSFTGSFLSNLKGHAKGRLSVAGPLKHINLTGLATVDGEATVTALGTTYQLRGDTIRFVPNDIVLDRFPIYDRDGHQATLTGGIHHNELSNFTFDLNINADQLLAYDFPDFNGSIVCGTVYATGTTDMHGLPGEVLINCNVTPQPSSFFAYNAANPDAISKQEFITWGEKLKVESSESSDFSSSEKGNVTQPSTLNSQPSTDIHINFLINATPEASLRVLMDQNTGDQITLNGSGTIRASFYDKGPFQMFGTYNVDHGTYGITIQNIIKKNFTFQPGGTIVFGGDPFNANLNLQALYTVNGVSLSDLNLGTSFASNTVRVNCLMNIMGTPGQPRVEFDLDMPTVNSEENQMIRSVIASEQEMNQQVLYLLGIGRFYTQGVNNASTQQYDQTTLAMQSFLSGTVSTQINEVLSQVIKSNDWNFGANISTGNEGWHNAEYEGLVSGRMLNNRLLINGQFGYRDNAAQATSSFIGDFDIRYLLTQNGNFAVKAYNQTNDRYFTRSSLNTQGIGLIMKRDFDGLSDLFHWRKRKDKH